jgi:hypothetical protein
MYAAFGAAIRGGLLDVRTDVVERLVGRAPRSLPEVLQQHFAATAA